MSVGGDIAVWMPHEDQVAVAFQLVARIGYHALFRRLDRRAFRNREVDAVILPAVRLWTEAGYDPALHRPSKRRQSTGGLRRLDGFGRTIGLRLLGGGRDQMRGRLLRQ